MKRKMPGKAVISMMLVLVLVLGATIGVFASDVSQDTTYDDGLIVDGSAGWNTGDGDNYFVTAHGTTVTFTNTPFQRDTGNWSNFIIETVSSDDADGITMRADAYAWTYGYGVNTPSYEVSISWDWEVDDFQAICTENTEITLIATKTSDTVVTFDILFGDVAEEVYTVTYADGVPEDLWFHVGADGGTVTINSVEYVDITGVTVDSVGITEYFTGDHFAVGGSVVTVSYEDGTTETLPYEENSYVRDSDGNYIYMYAEHLEYGYYGYGRGDEMYYTGAYGVYCVVRDQLWDEVLTTDASAEMFVVKDMEASDLEALDAQEMTVDTTYSVDTEVAGGSDWFSFTPATSGYYVFESSNQGSSDPYAYVYYVDANGNIITNTNDDSGVENNFKLTMYLEAGTTYYLRAYTYCGYSIGVYSVEVSETTVITAVSVSALSQTEFTQYVEYFDLTGTVVTVTYSDGTTADLTIDGSYATDVYGNTISYWINYTYEDEYGNTWTDSYSYYDSYVPSGTYVVYVNDNLTGNHDESQTITVNSLADYEDLTEIELLDEAYEVTDVESDTDTWFSFTPGNTSYYYFVVEANKETEIPEDAAYSNSDTYYFVFYLEDGDRVRVSEACDEDTGEMLYDESGEYRLYALTEGVTYYISVTYYCGYEIYVEDTGYVWNVISADISVTAQEVNHAHSYEDADKLITWTWAEDYSSATAVLRCDTCSYTETATATITSVTTDATATEAGSIVYTATVTINGVEYTDTVTVEIPATGDTSSTSGDGTGTSGDGTNSTGSTGTSSTGSTSPKTGDVSTVGYYVVLLFAAAAIAVLAKKRANA